MSHGKDRVDELFSRYDAERKASEERRIVEAKRAEEESLKATEFAVAEIMPALEEYRAALKARGSVSVSQQDQSCTIRFFPKDIERPRGADSPFLTFQVEADKVTVSGSNMLPKRGGSAGKRASIARADFGEQFLEDEILRWLDELLKGPWR